MQVNVKKSRNDVGYYSYDEIAVALGMSRQQVREIERSALLKLRHPGKLKKLHMLKESLRELCNIQDNLDHRVLGEGLKNV
jgi:hypothetical protein